MNFELEKVFSTPTNANFFFGYYDRRQISIDGRFLLAGKAEFNDRLPTKDDILKLGFFDINRGSNFYEFDEVVSWNWQQSCNLQWLNKSKDYLIYNFEEGGQYFTKIINPHTGEQRAISGGYAAKDRNDMYLLLIDYSKYSYIRPSYGYQGCKNFEANVACQVDRFCLATGERKIIFSESDAREIIPEKIKHDIRSLYVEHMQFSPNGQKFIFLLRGRLKDGAIISYLICIDIDGSKFKILNDSSRITHANWVDDDRVLYWGSRPNLMRFYNNPRSSLYRISRSFVPLYKRLVRGNSVVGNSVLSSRITGDSYQIQNVVDSEILTIDMDFLRSDGHPSVINGSILVTDTYSYESDGVNVQNLKVCSLSNMEPLHTLTIPHARLAKETGYRCDLHPRVDIETNTISIDTFRSETRATELYKWYVS